MPWKQTGWNRPGVAILLMPRLRRKCVTAQRDSAGLSRLLLSFVLAPLMAGGKGAIGGCKGVDFWMSFCCFPTARRPHLLPESGCNPGRRAGLGRDSKASEDPAGGAGEAGLEFREIHWSGGVSASDQWINVCLT